MSEHIEAEVLPTQAVAVRQPQAGALAVQSLADLEQSFALAVRQRELISDYIRKQLKPDKHFYTVRDASKPSLNKEGAELILLPHGLIPDYDIVSGPQEPTEDNRAYQITVKCILRSKGNPDSFAGSGIGSASSYITTRDGKRKPRQNDIGLCYNATVKMAQKSAMVAAVLNSTAASEFFTQDIEQDAPDPVPVPKPREQYRKEVVANVKKTPPPVAPPPVAKPDYKVNETPEERKERFLEKFRGMETYAHALWVELGILLPTEDFSEFPTDKVPATAKVVWDMVQEVKKRAGVVDPPPEEEPPPSEPSPTAGRVCPNCQSTDYIEMRSNGKVWWKCENCGRQGGLDKGPEGKTVRQVMENVTGEEEAWRSFPIPEWSKHFKEEGYKTFGDLPKEKLWWWCMKWEPKPYRSPKTGKTYPVKQEELDLRNMLDEIMEQYDFKDTE